MSTISRLNCRRHGQREHEGCPDCRLAHGDPQGCPPPPMRSWRGERPCPDCRWEHKQRQREGGGNLTRMECSECRGDAYTGYPPDDYDYCGACDGAGEVRGGSGWNRWRRVWGDRPEHLLDESPLILSVTSCRPDDDIRFTHAMANLYRAKVNRAREDRKREALAARHPVVQPVNISVPPGLLEAIAAAREAGVVCTWAELVGQVVLVVCPPSGDNTHLTLDEGDIGTRREATPGNIKRFVGEALGIREKK